MSRESNKRIAKEVLEYSLLMKKDRISNYYNAEDLLQMKSEQNVQDEFKKKTSVKTLEKDVVKVIAENSNFGKKIAVLNFASARNPGGGFLTGASAQEESIARASDLYLYLKDQHEFYKNPKHLKNGLYDSDVIYSKDVTLIKDGLGNSVKETTFDVITCCAPNLNAIQKNHPMLVKEVDTEMRKRIENVFEIALREKVDVLVLGAFGCGVFGNNPYMVKNTFRDVMQSPRYKNQFEEILFAIYKDKRLFNIFKF